MDLGILKGEMSPISAEAPPGKLHLTSGTSKGSFTPWLQLKKFPDIPVSTREEAQKSRPHPEKPRFRLLAREVGSFPAWSGKNSRRSRRISRGCARHRKGERNSRVGPPFPESPRCLSPFQGNLFSFTASTFKPRIDSHQGGTWGSPVGKPRGKASLEILEGKPQIP